MREVFEAQVKLCQLILVELMRYKMRKLYLDNIRIGIVWIVVVYHIIYSFNSVGVINNVGIKGIPQMDAFLCFVYPWFMNCLFLIGGISARHSLEKRSGRQFIKERIKRLLIPSIASVFILGWIIGYITTLYIGMFSGEAAGVPGIIQYLIRCMMGIGPLWFAHELFLASVVLLILRAIDKKDSLRKLGSKVNMPILLLLVLPVWGSSFVLNTPVVEVYRNGIYVFMFLLGYYIFSHNHVIEQLEKWKIPLLIIAILLGVSYTIYYYGSNYTEAACLNSVFTNLYLWIMILAILGCGKAWFDKGNRFTVYLNSRSFGVYVLHYPLIVVSIYFMDTYLKVPVSLMYVLLLLISLTLLPLLIEVVRRIPVVNFLLLGEGRGKS